jgi:hypothetical protein
MEQAFAPLSGQWIQVSPRLRSLRRVVLLCWGVLIALAAGLLLGILVQPALGAIAVLPIAAIGRGGGGSSGATGDIGDTRSASDDLLVTNGFTFRRLVVVPYGRMQFVDVAAGPLERRFGIATVQLHTAAEATDASIPGLTMHEATRLRDRLAMLGETRSAGL